MTREISFRLTNRLTENTGQSVLVFLLPFMDRTTEDAILSPWQTLNPAANCGHQSFVFRENLELAVENQATGTQSPTVAVRQNQLYTVTNNDNQGPVLHLSHSETPRSSSQVAVRNTTDPTIALRAFISISGSRVITQGGINFGTTVTFELIPTLFFVVVHPPSPTFRLPQFSHQIPFIPPPEIFGESTFRRYDSQSGVGHVEVSWMRPGGMSGADILVFDPPTAPLNPLG